MTHGHHHQPQGYSAACFSCLESRLPQEVGEFHEQHGPFVPGIITPAVIFSCVPGSLPCKGTVRGLGLQKHRCCHKRLVWPCMLGTDFGQLSERRKKPMGIESHIIQILPLLGTKTATYPICRLHESLPPTLKKNFFLILYWSVAD